MDHVAPRILLATLSLLAVPLLLPAASAEGIETPPVASQPVFPECNPNLRVNSRTYFFCGSGNSTACVEGVGCQGSTPGGLCSSASRLTLCVARQYTPPVPSLRAPTCFAQNPSAVTNVCLTLGSQARSVPSASVGTQSLCVVGDRCADVPTVVVGDQTVTAPAVSGYVEATALCPLIPAEPALPQGVGCRVAVPSV